MDVDDTPIQTLASRAVPDSAEPYQKLAQENLNENQDARLALRVAHR